MQNKDILVILLGGEIHVMFGLLYPWDLFVWPEMIIVLDYIFQANKYPVSWSKYSWPRADMTRIYNRTKSGEIQYYRGWGYKSDHY